MLIGTSRKLKNCNKLKVSFNGTLINSTTTYTYLGTKIESTLSINDQFDKLYKSMTSKLHLLKKMRLNLTFEAAKMVYNAMVVPIFTFNCISFLNLPKTKIDKLLSIQRHATSS